ncbi:DUF4894 domain-containing protein [Pseudothermotoga sp. U03pept]|uniref:DUF4894 domain-containing protein n=1 Tax=Pseudothermotoga sp. U03pept TaxID=3447012 RepID=UPI003EFFFCFC
MYNSSKAIIFVGAFLILFFSFSVLEYLPKFSDKHEDLVPFYLVSYKGRVWWVSENGKFLSVATSSDILKKAVVSGVKAESLSLSRESLEALHQLKDVLDNPYVAEVRLNERCAILLKGILLYLSDWKDLVRHVSKLENLIFTMEPKAEYFLTSVGLVYKIRGGGGEER